MSNATHTDVKSARERLGWSQKRLADELGVDQATISRWERDDSRVPLMARRVMDSLLSELAN